MRRAMMTNARCSLVEFSEWRDRADHRSAVSLHAHTPHSREVMSDLATYIVLLPVFGSIARRELNAFAERTGAAVDFSNGWWHPPVSPREVFDSEMRQI